MAGHLSYAWCITVHNSNTCAQDDHLNAINMAPRVIEEDWDVPDLWERTLGDIGSTGDGMGPMGRQDRR